CLSGFYCGFHRYQRSVSTGKMNNTPRIEKPPNFGRDVTVLAEPDAMYTRRNLHGECTIRRHCSQRLAVDHDTSTRHLVRSYQPRRFKIQETQTNPSTLN